MARTSKTKIGDYGEQAERTNRAAAVGAEMAQRAHSEYLAQQRFGQQQALQMAEQFGGWQERRQAAKEQSRQFDAEMAQRREIETGRQALDQQQIDMRAAADGYQRTPGAATSPLLDERMQRLQSEMDRGAAQQGAGGEQQGPQGQQMGQPAPGQDRRADQMRKGLEMPGANQPFIPTAEGAAMQRRKRFEADTERIRAEAYRDQVKTQLRKAQLTGDEDSEKKMKANLMQPISSDAKLLEAVAQGKFTEQDMDSIKSMVADVPDPALQEEVNSGIPGPRLRSFLSAKIAHGALNFIKDTGGDLPDNKVVDFTSPQMQQFSMAVKDISDKIGMLGPAFGQYLGLQSLHDKIRFQNEMAAKQVLAGMTARQAKASGPFGQMSPSTGGVKVSGQPQQPQPQQPQQPQQPPNAYQRSLNDPEAMRRANESMTGGQQGFGVK